ncbi:hypothetical protein V8E53_008953 [Lactarius tabidus]
MSPLSPLVPFLTSLRSNKQQSSTQSNRLSGSKKFNSIASVIGLKPKKVSTPVEEPPSPVLPLHTGEIDAPPRHTKSAHNHTVEWADPLDVQPSLPEDCVDSCGQSVFSADIDPFAAPGFPDCSPNIPESLRFSTLSDISTFESHVRKDAHNRMSFASSSSFSHHRSDVTSDFSPASSPLLSPITSRRHLSRLTVESDRVLPRESLLASPISPQSSRSGWDEASCIVTSPSSVTLTDINTAPPHPKTRPRGFTDVRPSTASGLDYSTSDQKLPYEPPLYNFCAPRVVVRQPSSTKIHSLRPPTAPPAVELPPAPESARRDEFSLLPAFPENTPQSPASSSSSLSFASSTSSVVPGGQRREVRRLKDSKKTTKSRPSSPSNDRSRNVRDSPTKVLTSRREFSPTRTLKKAISIQNLPKRPQGNPVPSPIVPTAEDSKPLKKQRSFHHTRILMPPFQASSKQANSSSISPGRDGPPVPDDRRDSAQSSPKVPITPPVSNPMRVRERLFSGSSSRRHASPQSPGPDDERQLIFSLPSASSPPTRPHTAIPVNRSSASHRPELSSFWDEEALKSSPATGSESQDYGPQQIMSPADLLKFENMVRDGENLSEFVRSRENSVTSVAVSKHSGHPAAEPAMTGGSLSPPPITRRLDFSQATDSRDDRPRTRGNSLHGKARESSNVHSSIGARSMSFQSLNALPGLPVPPRLRVRPSTSSGASTLLAESVPLLGVGDRSSVILHPLSPPPIRRNVARRKLDPTPPPSASVPSRPAITRRPSFLDMRDEPDRDPPPPEGSFLDMSKASLDTVRSSMEDNSTLS